ncbi:sigma-70 family RNA polymerase sigma factor [Portibacter marinus]|uniref:sigma-70 family RNA polymerase sigma factor n=1 Tax=Portibacter marinus TaxID=2898660 RepID=UPI001F188F8B|nr:sigma-70 family RNA polymerase sigma factor [Portibacter marinus]
MQLSYSNDEVFQLIKAGGKKQDLIIEWLYSTSGWTAVARRALSKMGAYDNMKDDCIQEGIISLIVDVERNKIRDPSALKSYFIQTCKNMWLNQYNRDKRRKEIISDHYDKDTDNENQHEKMENAEIWKHIDTILDQLGKKCKEVLKLWSMGFSHEEIAQKIGYESANVSKKTKSLCIKQLKAMGFSKESWMF